MEFTAYLSLFSATMALVLGAFVLGRDNRSAANILFFLGMLTSVAILFPIFLLRGDLSPQNMYIWKAIAALWPWTAAFFVHLSLLGVWGKWKKRLLLTMLYGLVAIFSIWGILNKYFEINETHDVIQFSADYFTFVLTALGTIGSCGVFVLGSIVWEKVRQRTILRNSSLNFGVGIFLLVTVVPFSYFLSILYNQVRFWQSFGHFSFFVGGVMLCIWLLRFRPISFYAMAHDIIHFFPSPILILDIEKRIVLFNEKVPRFLNVKESSLKGASIVEIIPDLELFEKCQLLKLQDGRSLKVCCVPLHRSNSDVVGYMVHMLDLAWLQEKVGHTESVLADSIGMERTRSFLKDITSDFLAPYNLLRENLKLMNLAIEKIPSESHSDLKRLLDIGQISLGRFRELWESIEYFQQKTSEKHFYLNYAVESCIKTFNNVFQRERINIVPQLCTGDLLIQGEETSFYRILISIFHHCLLWNFKEREQEIFVTTVVKEEKALLKLSLASHRFDEFISDDFIQHHVQNLHLNISFSQEGGIIITVPIQEIVKNRAEESSLVKGVEKYLLVDDEPDIRDILRTYLNDLGIGDTQITEAIDGDDAFQKIQENKFDYIFTDIVMPNMDGHELLEKIQMLKKDRPSKVFVLTGTVGDGLDSMPVDEVLQKPFNIKDIQRLLKRK